MSNPVSPDVATLAGIDRGILRDSVETAPAQQAATAPGSGARVGDDDGAGKLPFKEQVKAYAHIHHGVLTGNKEEKDIHRKVLNREIPPQ